MRLRTAAAKRFKKVEKATAVIRKTLLMPEQTFRRLDAPELHQSCNEVNGKPWQCGRAAKAKLTAIINRGNVTCEARAKDRYGRIVAVCSAEGVPDVGEEMVRDGYAVVLGFARSDYQELQDEAEAAKRGIWRGSFERPADWRAANPRVGD